MDQSKQYVAMCKAAEEIQDLFNDKNNRIGEKMHVYQQEEESDIGIIYVYENKSYCVDIPPSINVTWLPTQEQLQDLSSAFGIPGLLYEFNNFVFDNIEDAGKSSRYSVMFKSMEQLWLAFIMQEENGKQWNGQEWVEI